MNQYSGDSDRSGGLVVEPGRSVTHTNMKIKCPFVFLCFIYTTYNVLCICLGCLITLIGNTYLLLRVFPEKKSLFAA